MKRLSKNRGFTLIEILVVIGIIALLATIVVIAINPARQFAQARNTQRISGANSILNAIGQYTADNKGILPTFLVKGAAPVEVGVDLCNELVTTYLPSLPTDPTGSRKGESITTCANAVAGAVIYTVVEDNNGRITIASPNTELTVSTPCTTDCISVTR
jgi:type IV pilus assembly protein PilA